MDIKQKKQAYSIIETLVSILIFAFILMVVSSILITYIKFNQTLQMRYRIRSEMAHASNLLKRDIRNADSIISCQGQVCDLTIQGTNIRWFLETDAKSIRHLKRCTLITNACMSPSSNDDQLYNTSDILNITVFDLLQDVDITNFEQFTITYTIYVNSTNTAYNINNQISQEVISLKRQKLL